MKQKVLLPALLILLFSQFKLAAQPSAGGTPPSTVLKNLPVMIDHKVLNAPDMTLINAEDLLGDKSGQPYRNGVSIPVNYNLYNAGTWTELPNGDRIWRMKISVPGALALGVYYDHFWLPPGGRLFLYDNNGDKVLGAYTEKNNSDNGMFVNEMMSGETVILEYYEPSRTRGMAIISLSDVAYFYRGVSAPATKEYGSSESCEVNINCPEGTNWQDEKKGVARISIKIGTGYYWCSGSLVNNVLQDCTPLFLTADHCGNGATAADMNQWVFYFNYEAPTCSYSGAEPSSNTINGCTYKASSGGEGNTGSDFYLVQLSTAPTFSPYFNGWDRSTTASPNGVGIHHPAGDIQKISTYTSALVSDAYGSTPGSHWRVTWAATTTNHGVTEGGSSGSPIFNSAGLIVGDLTGGASYCSSPSDPDFYGKISYSWDQNGTTNDKKLQPWLDPGNTNAMSLNGYYCGSAPTLNADFSASATAIPVGGTVDFTDLSTGGPTTWSWTFNGGTPASSSVQNPAAVQYNTAGIYTVSLTIGDGTSTDTETKTNYITVGDPPPSADFVTDATVIPVGGTVNFTDLSGGSPTSWSWTFTGGTPASSTDQNPSGIVYNTAGTYTVSMTATNAQGSDTETKVNYITVGGTTPGDAPCDTLNYPLNGTEVLYSVVYPNSVFGYVSGTNGYSDKAKANSYFPSATYVNLQGAYFKFGKARKRSNYDAKVVFAVWDNSGPSGAPGAVPILTDTLMLSTIAGQVNAHQLTFVDFQPTTLSTPFYMGVYIPQDGGDTLALLTNKNGQTVPSNAWEQWENGTWYNYADPNSWGYELSHAIFPILCKADFNVEELSDNASVMVYPNPAGDAVTIDFGTLTISGADIQIYNLMGERVVNYRHSGSQTSQIRMDISSLASGLYTLHIAADNLDVVRKISVIK